MKHGNFLNLSQIKPEGWIREQMHQDLTQGFIGHLDELVPGLIKQDRIYDQDRRTAAAEKMDLSIMGITNVVEENQQIMYQWWNAETQSNWLDGFMRTAALVQDPQMIEKAKSIILQRLETQEKDGYIGIYEKDLRFKSGNENGELWAQSALFRALLAYYEYSGDETVLDAVTQSIDCIMKNYPMQACRPFSTENEKPEWSCHGISHGLTITDTFFQIYGYTKKKEYLDYAVWLYDSYCEEKKVERDIQIKNLQDETYRFQDHGVHAYEHLRTLALAYYHTGNPKYEEALNNYLRKLETCILPSGAPIGDEWICKMTADATITGYEYCSLQELLHSYAFLMQQTGDMQWAEKIEWLFFNAGLGARNPERHSIAYLNVDNAYAMEAVFQTEQPHCDDPHQNRYKYSPTHQDVAVCCVPNAGRIFPYYVQSMWMPEKDRLTKVLYGPSRMQYELDGTRIAIEEQSDYPYSGKMKFLVHADKKVHFSLVLRKPSWCKTYDLSLSKDQFREENGFICIEKDWDGSETIELDFQWEPVVHKDLLGDYYFSYGPLVMALPIESEETIAKEHLLEGFYDTHYKPQKDSFWDYSISRQQAYEVQVSEDGKTLKVKAYNNKDHKQEEITLIPMEQSILRKVTFKEKYCI